MGNATNKLPLQNKWGVILIPWGATQDARQAGKGRIVKQQSIAKEHIYSIKRSVTYKAVY